MLFLETPYPSENTSSAILPVKMLTTFFLPVQSYFYFIFAKKTRLGVENDISRDCMICHTNHLMRRHKDKQHQHTDDRKGFPLKSCAMVLSQEVKQ